MNYVGKLNGNITSSGKNLKRCLSVCLISVLQCSINFLVPLSVAGYTVLRVLCFQFCKKDRSRGKSSTAHVNTFPMIRWVFRRMRDGGWTLLPDDKEPGFCFIRHSETRDIAISSLVSGSCEKSHFLDMWLPRMVKTYGIIAKGIGELQGKRIQSAVLSSQWSEGATPICQITLLCKTTKSPGEVTFRCVHSGVSNMWTGLSAWLAHHLRVKIEMKLPNLLRDTKEFVDDLRHLHWQDGIRMIKMDIKEFYMSGNPCFLSHACSELFCNEIVDFQQLVAKAVDWLCRKQYVQSEFLPDLTYRVTRGSGMGLLHSGEVSDAGFWIAAERWLLTTSVRQWCSITYGRRFRDDIFAITSNFPRFKHVFRWLRSRAALEGYKLLTEDVSQNKITFLAVDVVVINGGFMTKPRERIVAPFLSEYSAHPRHVHISLLRKDSDQFVSIKKNNVLLKMISWQGFRGSSRVRQQFRESDGLWLNGVHE